MANNSIRLKDYTYIQNEALAAVAIKPGQFVELDANGKLILATAKATVQHFLAIENELEGEDKSDTYAIGDIVQYITLRPGDEVQALLDGVTTSPVVVIGDDLAVGAGGTLVETASAASGYVALEALSIASGVADALIKVRCQA